MQDLDQIIKIITLLITYTLACKALCEHIKTQKWEKMSF